MPFLSPAKLLVILVVALVVLGPDKLPKVAKQIGSLWGDFRKFRARLESDVRGNFPDLPSSETITQAVRSPLSFLDNLADAHSADDRTNAVVDADTESGGDVHSSPESNRPNGSFAAVEAAPKLHEVLVVDPGTVHPVHSTGSTLSDDPGMN